MGILDALNPVTGIIKAVKGVADLFIESPEKRNAFNSALAEIEATKSAQFEETMRMELDAKSKILIAELSQDDKFTKRARPSVVYMGLVLVALEVIARFVAFFVGMDLPQVEGQYVTTFVPNVFWAGWTAIVTTWSVGRTIEKRAKIREAESGRLTKLITGG